MIVEYMLNVKLTETLRNTGVHQTGARAVPHARAPVPLEVGPQFTRLM